MIPFKGKDSSEKSVGEGLDAGAAEVKSWLVFITSIPTLFTVHHPELTLTKHINIFNLNFSGERSGPAFQVSANLWH